MANSHALVYLTMLNLFNLLRYYNRSGLAVWQIDQVQKRKLLLTKVDFLRNVDLRIRRLRVSKMIKLKTDFIKQIRGKTVFVLTYNDKGAGDRLSNKNWQKTYTILEINQFFRDLWTRIFFELLRCLVKISSCLIASNNTVNLVFIIRIGIKLSDGFLPCLNFAKFEIHQITLWFFIYVYFQICNLNLLLSLVSFIFYTFLVDC